MQEYIDSFYSLDTMQQVYWICAIVGTLIFVVQLVLTLMGMDASDADIDFDVSETMDLGGGLSLFSIKNFVNFLVGFGWAGVCLRSAVSNDALLVAVSVVVGIAFVLMFFFIKTQTKKLEHNGMARIGDCVGKTVDVYLRIPAHREGKGKVQVSINGSVIEYGAMTDGEELKSGVKVRVMQVVDDNTVLVDSATH